MPAEVTREEFRALEFEVEGEKLVTRHVLEQTRHNGDDLAAIKTRLERVEGKVDDIPEQAFLYVGSIDDVREKAKELAK